jgi:hypothetical protein
LILARGGFLHEAFTFQFSLGEKFAQGAQAFGRFSEHLGHDRLADFENFAVVFGANGGGASFAGEQGKFAEAIALAHRSHAHAGAVSGDGYCCRAAQHDEHRITGVAFLDQTLAASVTMDRRILEHVRELRVIHAIEERLAPHDRPRFRLRIAGPFGAALNLKGADGEGDGDLLASKLVPNVGPDGVADVVISAVIAHRELDLVNDR